MLLERLKRRSAQAVAYIIVDIIVGGVRGHLEIVARSELFVYSHLTLDVLGVERVKFGFSGAA
jgi:hypothetical protein